MMRLFSLLIVLSMMMPVQAADLEASVSLDRYSGLLIGDPVTATVRIPVDASELDLHALPQHDKRQGPWFYLGDVSVKANTLILQYQIINVPPENRVVTTPVFDLRTKNGEFIAVPAVNVQIGSFLATDDEGNAELAPRADMPVPIVDTHDLTLRFWLAIGLLVFASLIWLIWHFGLRPRQRLPFATALFELNKMRLLGRRDAELASRHLHHAFNRSAGRVVIHSQLDILWQSCPWLLTEKPAIEQFYANSAAHFFTRTQSNTAHDFADVLALVKACRALERVA